jgi:hypothetical protein
MCKNCEYRHTGWLQNKPVYFPEPFGKDCDCVCHKEALIQMLLELWICLDKMKKELKK